MKLNCFSMLIEMDSDIEVSRHFARGSVVKNNGQDQKYGYGVMGMGLPR